MLKAAKLRTHVVEMDAWSENGTLPEKKQLCKALFLSFTVKSIITRSHASQRQSHLNLNSQVDASGVLRRR